MAVPILRHYRAHNVATSNTTFEIHAAVPAGRALVISKVVFTDLAGITHSISLLVGPDTSTLSFIANSVILAPGDVYTETGLVVLAGEKTFARTNAANAQNLAVAVFGQEVDN